MGGRWGEVTKRAASQLWAPQHTQRLNLALNCPHVSDGVSPKWELRLASRCCCPSTSQLQLLRTGGSKLLTQGSCTGEPKPCSGHHRSRASCVSTLPLAPEAGLSYSQPGEDHRRATDVFAGRVCPGQRFQARN